MLPLPLSLVLMLALVGAEWLYVQTFFTRVEPALIARAERALDVEVRFGLLHHWNVRPTDPPRPSLVTLRAQVALLVLQLGTMLAFALGLLALAAAVFGPAIWLYRRS